MTNVPCKQFSNNVRINNNNSNSVYKTLENNNGDNAEDYVMLDIKKKF